MLRTPPRGVLAAAAALALTLGCASAANADTFTVNTTTDNSDPCAASCSLRGAIEDAGATAGDDTINLPNGRYYLTDQAGALVVDGKITLKGDGAGSTFVDAVGNSRVFEVNEGAELDASGITVRGGRGPNMGECYACEPGGGIFAPGATVHLTDVTVEDNYANAPGGGVYLEDSTASFTRVLLQDNHAQSGGAIGSVDSSVTMTDSNVVGNRADGSGGGLSNTANQKSEVTFATAAATGSVGSDVTITNSTFSHNMAGGSGGAIYNAGLAVSSFGAPAAAAPQDGAGTVTLTNSTISDNSSFEGSGGGIRSDAILELVNDTIVGNYNVRDGALPGANVRIGGPPGGSATAVNTLIANGAGTGPEDNCSTGLTSLGHNLDSGTSCGFTATGDLQSKEPKLGPLADNGGLTPTRALLDGSPAIDAGDNGNGPDLDQRGGDRPPADGSAGATRDIGAYEAYSLGDLSIEAKAANATITAGQQLTYTVVARNDGNDKINGVVVSDKVPNGTTLVSTPTTDKAGASCDQAVTCNLGTLGVNEVVRITIVVTPTSAGSVTNTASIGATNITDPVPGNESRSVTTTVNAAAVPPQQAPQQANPDRDIELNIDVPKKVNLDTFFNGILVEADCGDEQCLRKFREHAAVNTGATHIAGFNLTIERTSLGFSTKKKTVRLKPCVSGSKNGRAHKRCVRNLRKATAKAVPFRVKVVVSAVDRAGNHLAKKAYIKVVE